MLDLLLAALMTAFLIGGVLQIVSAASSSFLLQDNQAEVLENGRQAISLLSRTVREAGYSPEPWNSEYKRNAIMPESENAISTRSDRLVVRAWSKTNCYENVNPARDADGESRFFLKESLFERNNRGDLARTCRYGPSESDLVTQINHEGVVQNVESFQMLYGEDISGNNRIDHWVPAKNWMSVDKILAVRFGLLLRSSDSVVRPQQSMIEVLDEEFLTKPDGRIHQLFVFTVPLKSSLR